MSNVHKFALVRLGLPWVLAMSLLVSVCGCSRTARVERHLARGQKFFNAEQYDKAEIEFLNVLRLQATNSIALRHLGLAYHQQGRLLQAYAFLQKASEVTPADDEVLVRLAGVLRSFGRIKEARNHAEAVVERDPQNEEALMLLGEAITSTNEIAELRQRLESLRPQAEHKAGFHLALGSLDLRQRRTNEARMRFEHALALDPRSSPAHMAMGNIFVLLTDTAKADVHFKKAAELAPIRSARRLHYADFKLRNGDATAARAHLDSMAKQAPDYLPTFTRLSEVALIQRRFDDAAALSRHILARDLRNYEAMLLLGRINLARGEPAKAVADLDRVVSAYPRVPQAHHQLAIAHLMNRNHAKADDSLQQALALDPSNTDSILLLAELHIRKNDANRAISSLKKLINEQPHVAQAHLLLANAYRNQRDLESANSVYANMIKTFAGSPQPFFLWGQNLLLQQKTNEARSKFESAIEVSPEFVPALGELTDLDISAKQFAGAEQRIRKHIAARPKSAALHLLLARVRSAEKKFDSAEEALTTALAIEPDYEPAYLALARVYVASDKYKAALEKLNAALLISSNNVPALMQIGMIHTQLKDYPAARDAYEKLLQVNPRYVPALNNLAYICSEHLNLLDKAFSYARAARDLRPGDPFPADTLGWILFKRGEYPWALSLLQESANSDRMTRSGEVLFHLGMVHYMLGEEEPARAAFERAVESNEDFAGKTEALQKLSLLSANAAAPQNVAALEQQLSTSPRDPILLARLATFYEQSGAPQKAVAVYDRALQHNPRNVSAMVKLAELYAGPMADQSRAMQLARKARELAPEDPAIHHTLGRLAFQAGDHKWALSLLQESGRKLPADSDVLYDLAWAWYSVGRVADADATMRQALATGTAFAKAEDAKRFIECVRVCRESDLSEPARRHITDTLAHDPTYSPALIGSAMFLEKSDNPSAAPDVYRRVLKRFPAFIPAHKRLAILLTVSDPVAAFEHAVQARGALPDDPEIARTLGVLTFRRNEYARAAQLLKESLLQRPNDAETLYFLGSALFQLNEKQQSRQALEKAVAAAGNASFVPDARRMLARLK